MKIGKRTSHKMWCPLFGIDKIFVSVSLIKNAPDRSGALYLFSMVPWLSAL